VAAIALHLPFDAVLQFMQAMEEEAIAEKHWLDRVQSFIIYCPRSGLQSPKTNASVSRRQK
jgi:hypothetical protein